MMEGAFASKAAVVASIIAAAKIAGRSHPDRAFEFELAAGMAAGSLLDNRGDFEKAKAMASESLAAAP